MVLAFRQTVKAAAAACGLRAGDSRLCSPSPSCTHTQTHSTHTLGNGQMTIPGYNGLIVAHTLKQTEYNLTITHSLHKNTHFHSGVLLVQNTHTVMQILSYKKTQNTCSYEAANVSLRKMNAHLPNHSGCMPLTHTHIFFLLLLILCCHVNKHQETEEKMEKDKKE